MAKGISFRGRIVGLEPVKGRIRELGRGFTRDEAEQIGRLMLAKMKDLISRGNSPIEGGVTTSKFPPYKNPKRYPGKKKPSRPVNLQLTGAMLAALLYKVIPSRSSRGFGVDVGYFDDAEALKEKGHRYRKNGQPHRPTIPIGDRGEAFVPEIRDAYMRVIRSAKR